MNVMNRKLFRNTSARDRLKQAAGIMASSQPLMQSFQQGGNVRTITPMQNITEDYQALVDFLSPAPSSGTMSLEDQMALDRARAQTGLANMPRTPAPETPPRAFPGGPQIPELSVPRQPVLPLDQSSGSTTLQQLSDVASNVDLLEAQRGRTVPEMPGMGSTAEAEPSALEAQIAEDRERRRRAQELFPQDLPMETSPPALVEADEARLAAEKEQREAADEAQRLSRRVERMRQNASVLDETDPDRAKAVRREADRLERRAQELTGTAEEAATRAQQSQEEAEAVLSTVDADGTDTTATGDAFAERTEESIKDPGALAESAALTFGETGDVDEATNAMLRLSMGTRGGEEDGEQKDPADMSVKERTDELLSMYKEMFGTTDKEKANQNALTMAMIGFAIASGTSPNALENISAGLLTGVERMREDAATRTQREDKLKMLAFEQALGEEESRLQAQREAAARREEFGYDLALARAEGTSFGKRTDPVTAYYRRLDALTEQASDITSPLASELEDMSAEERAQEIRLRALRDLEPGYGGTSAFQDLSAAIAAGSAPPRPGGEPSVSDHQAANEAAKRAGESTYVLGGQTYEVQ